MNAVKDKIIALVGEELEAANAIYPQFRSMHEGYAVLREEAEEAAEEMDYVNRGLQCLWYYVRTDEMEPAAEAVESIERHAIRLAAEAIQAAAMARKFQAIGKDMSPPGMEVE
jgi:hypothetical protein